MKCHNCGGKMVKWKYLQYEELEGYLLGEGGTFAGDRTYEEWLKSL